jgi:hypothetical protein
MLYVNAPFNQATDAIRSANGNLASSYDVARARIHAGSGHSLSTYGSWVREGFVYTPEQTPLLVRESPLIEARLARDATNAHSAGKDFYLDTEIAKNFADQAEQDASKAPQDRRVLRFEKATNYSIPTNRFADDVVTAFLFKDVAADYGRFLASNGIKKMPVWFADKNSVDQETMPFLRQLWLLSIDCDDESDLVGDGWSLHGGSRVRGVRPSGASVASDVRENSTDAGKSELAYDPIQIEQYKTILQGVRNGNVAASELESVLEFMQGLPVKK